MDWRDIGSTLASARLIEHGRVRTPFGPAIRIQIERTDLAPMSFAEVYAVFARHYPDRWAVQAFPPRSRLLDQANRYHLHVLEQRPAGLDLFEGTEAL